LNIVINGESRDTRATTLAELCAALGFGDSEVATAINGDFVPANARAGRALTQNDHVEIVSPRQGG